MQTLDQLQKGMLAGATRLQLSCGLSEFPREIFDLADTLEILDLSGNALSRLPDELPRLHRLRVIFCSSNNFTVLPAVLGSCASLTMIGFKSNRIAEVPAAALPPALRWLILTDNCIGSLPATIGGCEHLQKLMLAGNLLTTLPNELSACRELELLRIAANRLESLPGWLAAMPRLSWLAFAGNPFVGGQETDDRSGEPAPIKWQRLQLGRQLGEGASGVIYEAALDAGDQAALPVAVKVFKGAVTSDGLPDCELAACMAAGSHPNLIPVLGEVSGHPEGRHGCVMALIDPAYRNLAGPPSLDSCTRDVYLPERHFSLAVLLRLAQGIAAAAAQLHQRGIMHGDLYGHNILYKDDGAALLGDFGAASRFDAGSGHAIPLQQVEVRAFGILLGELLARCAAPTVPAALAQLQRECIGLDAAARPRFDDIVARLAIAG